MVLKSTNPNDDRNVSDNTDKMTKRERLLQLVMYSLAGSGFTFVGLMITLIRINSAASDSATLARTIRVPATILKSYMYKGVIPSVDYTLIYEGKTYTPDNWQLHAPSSSTKQEDLAILRQYKPGEKTTAYFLPDHPQESFLDPGYQYIFKDLYETVAYGIVFLSVGMAWIPAVFFSGRKLITGAPDLANESLYSWRVAFILAMLLIGSDMIWYWTHSAPPYATASYIWFGAVAFLGVLSTFKPFWLINIVAGIIKGYSTLVYAVSFAWVLDIARLTYRTGRDRIKSVTDRNKK